MHLLPRARFYTTVQYLNQLPQSDIPEIAFAGRSNAGKSTAINTLCQQKRLAFSSKTPGRTQHINLFSLTSHQPTQHRKDLDVIEDIQAFFVDLPGYGYAQVPESVQAHWRQLLESYLQTRKQLVGLVLLMDSRHPLTPLDQQMIEWFVGTQKPIHCLLTKSDKLGFQQAQKVLKETQAQLQSYVSQTQAVLSVQLFSALKKTGVEEAAQKVKELLNLI